jgi:hypothetical protein
LEWSYSGSPFVIVPSINLFSQRGDIYSSSFPILNNIVSITTSSLFGAGLSVATCGHLQSFSITLRDTYSNLVQNIYSNSVHLFCRILSVPGACTNCLNVAPCHVLLNTESGVGLASYVVTKSGQYVVKVSIASNTASKIAFLITESPWFGYLSITSTGTYFFSISAVNATSISVNISGQTWQTFTTPIFLNSSIGSFVPIEVSFDSTGLASSLSLSWKEPEKVTFLVIPTSSFYGPRSDLTVTNTLIASSSNMPSPLFSTLTYLTTFTAGVIGTVTLTVKDKFENNISLNSFNDSMAFVSKISLSNESDEFISFPIVIWEHPYLSIVFYRIWCIQNPCQSIGSILFRLEIVQQFGLCWVSHHLRG